MKEPEKSDDGTFWKVFDEKMITRVKMGCSICEEFSEESSSVRGESSPTSSVLPEDLQSWVDEGEKGDIQFKKHLS
jgi:hypothetical protein